MKDGLGKLIVLFLALAMLFFIIGIIAGIPGVVTP